MSNPLQRVLTGAVFGIIVIGSILFNYYSFALVLLAVNCIGLQEFYKLMSLQQLQPLQLWGVITSILIFISILFLPDFPLAGHFILLLLAYLFLNLVFIIEIFRKQKRPFLNIAATILGIIYITFPLCSFILASNECVYISSNRQYLCSYLQYIPLGFFIILWTNDTAAYLIGIAAGKHPLIPSVSPKKTWEGLVGGTIFGMLAAYVLSGFYPELSLYQWLSLGAIISVFAPFGDLVESVLKRSVGVKNSGNILPGHGGVLDRFDGLFLSAPVFWLYLQIIKF